MDDMKLRPLHVSDTLLVENIPLSMKSEAEINRFFGSKKTVKDVYFNAHHRTAEVTFVSPQGKQTHILT